MVTTGSALAVNAVDTSSIITALRAVVNIAKSAPMIVEPKRSLVLGLVAPSFRVVVSLTRLLSQGRRGLAINPIF